jgi:Sulfotransferase domain
MTLKKPDFFIVGAPKSGTTAMNEYLSAHPEIYIPPQKEMHFFGADLNFGGPFYRRDLAAYLDTYAACDGQKRAGEASVWYLYSTQAAAEIKAFNPHSSIIIMLREPVEMLYSLYYQFLWDANEHLPTFEAALAAEDDRRAGKNISRTTYLSQGLLYREAARYTDQVKRYFDVFGRERVHVIVYDDFAADPRACYQNTLAFLGVDPLRIETDFAVVNANKYADNVAVRNVLRDPIVRRAARAIRPFLPRPIYDALQNAQSRFRRSNTRVEKRPPLDPGLRAALKREFAPEVQRLSELLGRDLSAWSQ